MDNNSAVPFKQIYNTDRSNALHRKSIWNKLHIDWPLMLCILVCFSIGLLVIYSAKLDFRYVQKQFINFSIATAVMLLVAQVQPRTYRTWAPVLYFGSLAMTML